MLQTLRAPPEKGTLRESALILLLMKIESIEHAKFRALSQIVIDQDKGVEAFEEYMKLAFPYLEATKQRDRQKYIEMLNREIAKGPLVARVIKQPKGKSRLKQRVVSVTKSRNTDAANRFYEKLGDTGPL